MQDEREKRRNISRLLCGSKKRQERSRRGFHRASKNCQRRTRYDSTYQSTAQTQRSRSGKILPRQSLREDSKRRGTKIDTFAFYHFLKRTAKSKLNALLLRLPKGFTQNYLINAETDYSYMMEQVSPYGTFDRNKSFRKSRTLLAKKKDSKNYAVNAKANEEEQYRHRQSRPAEPSSNSLGAVFK